MFERDFSELLENGFRETRNHKTRGKVCEPNLLFTLKLESHRERDRWRARHVAHFPDKLFLQRIAVFTECKREEENKKSMICETQSVGLKVVFTYVLATLHFYASTNIAKS